MPEISYMVFNIGTGINEGISERINDSARCDCLRKHFDDLVVDVNVLGITKCV